MALETTDPLALALLRSGGGGGMGSGPILIQQPEQKMRMMLAQQLMGADPASARTKGEGIARFAQQLSGALLAKQSMDEAKAQRDSDSGLMAAALRSQDKTPTTYTDDAGKQQTIKWNAPDPSAMTSIMAQGSPGLQQQALAMALNDRQRQADIALKSVKMLTPDEVRSAGLPPGAYQRDAYGKVDQIAKAPLFGMPGSPGGALPPAGGAPAPQGGGTQTVPKAAGGMTAAPLRPAIARAALENNVDPVMALTAAHIESGMGTAADRKGSQYQGVFQMGDDRWREAGGTPEARSDQGAQVNVGVRSLGLTRDQLAQKIGRQPEPWEVYLAHQQGVTGAAALLANPDQPAVEALKPFYEGGKNLQAIIGNTPGTPDANITAGGFTGLWRDRFNNIAKNYGNFTPQVAQGGAAPAGAQQDMQAGLADPARAMPPGSATVSDAPAAVPPQQATAPTTASQPVQVAQANTGTMTDAAPAAAVVPPPAAAPAQQFRRPIDPESGKMLDFELPVGPNGDWPRLPDGRVDISQARPYEARTNDQKDYAQAKAEGFTGSLLDYQKALKQAGKTDINFGDRAADQTVGKYIGEAFSGAVDGGKSARQDLANLDRMQSYLDQIKTGRVAPTTAALDRWARGFGIELNVNPQAPVAEALASLSNQMALKLRDPSSGAGMPGSLSDSDRRFLTEMVPSLANTPEGNQLMIDYSRRLAERRLDTEKIALDHIERNGGKVTPSLLREMADFGNSKPLFSKVDYERAAAYGGASTGGAPASSASAAPPPGARPAPPIDGQPSYTMPNGQTVIPGQGQTPTMPALPPGFQIVR
ncbi:hypothetical protein [Azospirillum palustre]